MLRGCSRQSGSNLHMQLNLKRSSRLVGSTSIFTSKSGDCDVNVSLDQMPPRCRQGSSKRFLHKMLRLRSFQICSRSGDLGDFHLVSSPGVFRVAETSKPLPATPKSSTTSSWTRLRGPRSHHQDEGYRTNLWSTLMSCGHF